MDLRFRFRALAAPALPFHGMGLCVGAGKEASADRARAQTDVAA